MSRASGPVLLALDRVAEAGDELAACAASDIRQLRTLLNAWLHAGAMSDADLTKLKLDTEEALQHG